jgi:hypothetical protein
VWKIIRRPLLVRGQQIVRAFRGGEPSFIPFNGDPATWAAEGRDGRGHWFSLHFYQVDRWRWAPRRVATCLRRADTVEAIGFHCVSFRLTAGCGRRGELRRGLAEGRDGRKQLGHAWVESGRFGDDLRGYLGPPTVLFAHMDTRASKTPHNAPRGTTMPPRIPKDGIWGPLRPMLGRSWGPR